MTDRYDGAWLDSMYNNRASIPEHPEHFRRWAEDSADVLRNHHPRALDVRYGDGANEKLDVFPAPHAGAPVLFFIHGGYWRAFDKNNHAFIAPAFTREGACVVIPNYALCPAVTIPQIVMQMVQALAWTWRNIARHGGDPGRITVMGHSAGGHLAAMTMACLWPVLDKSLPADLVKHALSISGLHDLEPIMHTPYLQPSLNLTPQQVQQASPARLPAPAQGILYAVTGALESEEYQRQRQVICDAWGAARVPVCEALPGLNHLSVLESLTEPGTRLNELAVQMLQT
jgi:arylformamidase